MKRLTPIARTSLAVVGAVVLAFATGCDQQGSQLTQLTESFQKKIDEKDKLLIDAQKGQQAAVAQRAELEGKLLALQAELDKAHASGGNSSAGGAGISAEKLSAQLAALLDPMIRKAVQQSVAANPVASSPTVTSIPNPPPTGRTGANSPTNPPPGLGSPTVSDRKPPKDGGLVEVPPNGRKPRNDGPIDLGPPPTDKEAGTDPKRPATGPGNKIKIDLPPLGGR
jgi:hypothetical protein